MNSRAFQLIIVKIIFYFIVCAIMASADLYPDRWQFGAILVCAIILAMLPN